MIQIFAIAALICFVLAMFGAHLGSIDFVILGLAFVACHLIWAWTPWRH